MRGRLVEPFEDPCIARHGSRAISVLELLHRLGLGDAQIGNGRPFNKSYALLIGVGKYRHLDPLTWSGKDVDRMRAFLESQ